MSAYNLNLEKLKTSNDVENSAIEPKYKVGNLIPSILVFQNDDIFVKKINIKKTNTGKVQQTNTCVKFSNFLNMRIVDFNQFINICNNNNCFEFMELWNQFKKIDNTDCTCSLLNKVTILSNPNVQTSNDFTIHCNGRYNISKKSNAYSKIHNVCSFVEVKYITDNIEIELTEIASVVAIVKFKDDDAIFLVICLMEKSIKNHSVLPYESYQYCVQSRKLFYDIVSIKNVIRPAWLISHQAENELNWADIELKTYEKLKNEMFYILPYNVIVRDQCDDFIEFKGDYTQTPRNENNANNTENETYSNTEIYNALPMMLSADQIECISYNLKLNMDSSDGVSDESDNEYESDNEESDESDNDS